MFRLVGTFKFSTFNQSCATTFMRQPLACISMMAKKVRYKEWLFEVDSEQTIQTYETIESGSPERCTCSNCKNFKTNRLNIYPQEIISLLTELGIDYRKEAEIFEIERLKNGLHVYGGWFHFKGKILEGKDSKIDLGGGGSTLDFKEVNSKFRIAFTKGGDLTYFNKNEIQDLIQVEFIAQTDWVIEKEL